MIVMTLLERFAVFGAEFWNASVDSGGIANFQTVFNLLTAIVLIPFAGQLVKLSKLVVKDDAPAEQPHPELLTLDQKLYISPAVAVNEATKAVAAMGAIARDNFAAASKQLITFDPAAHSLIDQNENCLDQFADSADHFLIGLSKAVESGEDDRQVDMLLQTVPNFERVGDYATNLVELAQRLQDDKSAFSESAVRELEILSNAVNEILDITVTAFSNNDNETAKRIEPLEEIIDDMVFILRDRHTKRLKSGACSISSGLVFMEMLTYMERASVQCSSIALMMLARNNSAILQNHYDYLRELHAGNDAAYAAEKDRRREQYITPLKSVQ
jgi:phosphate:Na+ symporter